MQHATGQVNEGTFLAKLNITRFWLSLLFYAVNSAIFFILASFFLVMIYSIAFDFSVLFLFLVCSLFYYFFLLSILKIKLIADQFLSQVRFGYILKIDEVIGKLYFFSNSTQYSIDLSNISDVFHKVGLYDPGTITVFFKNPVIMPRQYFYFLHTPVRSKFYHFYKFDITQNSNYRELINNIEKFKNKSPLKP